ncbi:amidohydrolase family protein [Xylophilus sp. GW821-FHT01B05]
MHPTKPPRGVTPLHFVDHEWLALRTEDVIDPGRPIVDAHHHIWEGHHAYLVPDLLQDLRCGHQIRGTVYVECSFMYRADGDPRFASIGEIEYANGVAASFASGAYGPTRAVAGIVGHADLMLGPEVRPVLEACVAHAPDRFRGIRHMTAWDASSEVNLLRKPPAPAIMRDPRFRAGFAELGRLGLSFDAWCYHPQLPELLALVDASPDTTVIIDHMGGLVGKGPYAEHRTEAFQQWQTHMRDLALRPNVFVKLGGLNMRVFGFDFIDRDMPPSSEELAPAWAPAIEACIEAFGPARCMFESNFPPDKCGVSARTLWNAFKRVVESYSESEQSDLFAGTAIRAYRLPAELGQAGRT